LASCEGKEKVFGETDIYLKHIKLCLCVLIKDNTPLSVWQNRASVLLNRVSVSSKRMLTLAKKDLCLHQTEPLFEPKRASVYVWFYYSYSLCGYVSTLLSPLNKIKIWPIDALLEVLGFTTFSIYLVFQFEWHSNLCDIPIWVTFKFE
jgi:hypothetical protein